MDSVPPPPYSDSPQATATKDEHSPCTITLDGDILFSTESPRVPIYRLGGNVTKPGIGKTSMDFSEVNVAARQTGEKSPQQQDGSRRLFYLVHPQNASYRDDRPPYYMTRAEPASSDSGNVRLETDSRPSITSLRKTVFTAMLSRGRSAFDRDLFSPRDGEEVLFSAKEEGLTRNSKRCAWSDSTGTVIAFEGDDSKRGSSDAALKIVGPMTQPARELLIATWCLKLWHNTAETKRAKRDGEFRVYRRMNAPLIHLLELERQVDSESYARGGMRFSKDAAGVMSLGAAGSSRK